MLDIKGFFSYAHADDSHLGLTKLRENLCNEFRSLTGENLMLFIDKNSLEWGQLWRNEITASIDKSSFFIPIYSPSYFMSSNCVEEFKQFSRKIELIGADCLILPILYIPIRTDFLNLDADLLDEACKYQYEDWTDLRFMPETSEEYRRAINRMALRLARADRELITVAGRSAQEDAVDLESGYDDAVLASIDGNDLLEKDSGQRGYLEDSVEIEDIISELSTVIEGQTESLVKIGDIGRRGTQRLEEVNRRGAGPKGALSVVGEIAKELKEVAKEFEPQAKRYSDLVNELNPRMLNVLSVWRTISTEERIRAGIEEISTLIEQTEHAVTNVKTLRSTLSKAARMSRVLYDPMREIEKSLTLFISASNLILGWGTVLEVE